MLKVSESIIPKTATLSLTARVIGFLAAPRKALAKPNARRIDTEHKFLEGGALILRKCSESPDVGLPTKALVNRFTPHLNRLPARLSRHLW